MSKIDVSSTPWTYEAEPYDGYREIYSNYGETIAKVEAWDESDVEAQAEALLNVKRMVASNHLLTALERLLGCAELNQDDIEPETITAIEEAVKVVDLAKGGGSP